MEGPTPSSAVFYGALSVHLGVFLLLRVSPVLDSAPWLSVLVIVLGLVTSAFAYLAGRVQADIKSALAFASLTQVGIIIAEIGFGFRYLALIHLMGHACLRTLQFLREPAARSSSVGKCNRLPPEGRGSDVGAAAPAWLAALAVPLLARARIPRRDAGSVRRAAICRLLPQARRDR
jgi:NAD(P)H-quinone oxidoreductase subunit 5